MWNGDSLVGVCVGVLGVCKGMKMGRMVTHWLVGVLGVCDGMKMCGMVTHGLVSVMGEWAGASNVGVVLQGREIRCALLTCSHVPIYHCTYIQPYICHSATY